jgi:hypothetical protein
MEWIKARERMPPLDDGKWLLFVFEDRVIMGSYETAPGGVYFIGPQYVRYHPDRVDYWMLVPPIPIPYRTVCRNSDPLITLPAPVNHIVSPDKKVEDTTTTNSSEPTI